jgi:hypothetical protein
MKATRSIRSLLVLSALSSLAQAQNAPAKPAQAQPKEAAVKAEPRELSFTVTGLTQDNMGKVKESLMTLMAHVYACDACQVEMAKAGTCPKCQGALKEKTHAMFQKIQPSVEGATLALTIDPNATLRLSELDGNLAKSSVKIDAAKFTLPGRSRLIVKGATAETTPTIEKALIEAKLFDEVKAKFEAATNELAIVVRAGATAPTKAKVMSTLEAAKVQLADVVWGPMGPKT